MKIRIRDCCKINVGYSFRESPKKDENGDAFLLHPKNINLSGSIEYTQCIRISTVNIKKNLSFLNVGDIVLTNRGSFKSAVFNNDGIFIVSNALFIIRADAGICNSDYLSIWLNSPAGQKQLEMNALVSGTIAALQRNSINDIEIYLPDMKVQREISAAYHLNNRMLDITKEIYELRKTQLEYLMKGADI